jgi:K+-sensing histidine kinase KdpD
MEPAAAALQPVTSIAAGATSGASVLIIEADEHRAAELKGMLVERATHVVATARQAISYCRSADVDCVVLSSRLPDYEASGLIPLLRDKDTREQLPVVFLLAARDDQDAVNALRQGASDALAWDRVSPQTLTDKVDQAINRVGIQNTLAQHRLENELHALELARRQEMIVTALDELVHALRTPLASINEFISLVLDGVGGTVNERHGKFLALARGACWTLDRAVGSVYEIADATSNLSRTNMRSARIQDAFDVALSEVQLEAEHAGISVHAARVEDLPAVRADISQICQVLIQLASRAVSVLGPGGKLLLEASRVSSRQPQVRVALRLRRREVKDTNIFALLTSDSRNNDLAAQLHTPRCAEIVSGHGSTLDIESDGYAGCTVSFTLNQFEDPTPGITRG